MRDTACILKLFILYFFVLLNVVGLTASVHYANCFII